MKKDANRTALTFSWIETDGESLAKFKRAWAYAESEHGLQVKTEKKVDFFNRAAAGKREVTNAF